MVVTCSRASISMNYTNVLETLQKQYPQITFSAHSTNYWSPENSTVYFHEGNDSSSIWTLLHETSHGLLNHTQYTSDFHLVLLEVEAWEQAKKIAVDYGIVIAEDYIQDCLDSYRDWQYKRSLCPTCALGGVQIDSKTYHCLFCIGTWTVSRSRFCRPYRRSQ